MKHIFKRIPCAEAAGRILEGICPRIVGRSDFSRLHDVEARWNLVKPHLPDIPSWMLDVGCNTGDTCKRIALEGHYAVGLEINPDVVARARKYAGTNVAIMETSVSPEMLATMPKFDVVFLFSVAHRMWAIKGREYAEKCIARCFEKTDLLFFEGAIRHVRFTDKGMPPPDFADCNVSSGRQWHDEWLRRMAPQDWAIDYLGEVHPLNRNAPRLVFMARNQAP